MSHIDARFNSNVFRNNFANLVAKEIQRLSILGVRLAYDVNGYYAGVALALNSVSSLHQKYVSGGASGTGTPDCILLDNVLNMATTPSNETPAARAVRHGCLFNNQVIDSNGVALSSDAGAMSKLGAITYTEVDGTVIFDF